MLLYTVNLCCVARNGGIQNVLKPTMNVCMTTSRMDTRIQERQFDTAASEGGYSSSGGLDDFEFRTV
jgi:hypothetical protein